MNFLKIFALVTLLSSKVGEALQDQELSVKEILDIAEEATKKLIGKDFSQIAIKFAKDEKGRTKVEFVI